jgi:coenzyme PQQ biosynthesis protein PqqD
VIDLSTRPRLAQKARLRSDPKSGRYMLLYPERGMALNPTGAEILKLCTGERTVAEIIATLVARHAPAPQERIEREVLSFLEALHARALVG